MEHTILKDIPFEPDLPALLEAIHVRPGTEQAGEVSRLAGEAQAIARPKALYTVSFVDEKGDAHVVVDGIRFKSHVLRVNLEPTHRVFAFVATAGTELEDWANGKTDMLCHFYACAINEVAVHAAMAFLERHLVDRFGLGHTGRMNPGSLGDWPISEQRPLFAVLGDTEGPIGVRLLPSMLMVPTKSVSGLLFPTEAGFRSCQLCPREVCPNRGADYDPGLYERKYRQTAA